MEQMTPPMGQEPGMMTKQNSHRTFLFSLIILAVVVIAGIVILSAGRDFGSNSGDTMMENETMMQDKNDMVADKLSEQGTSTNLSDIEADLNATDFGSIDSDTSF